MRPTRQIKAAIQTEAGEGEREAEEVTRTKASKAQPDRCRPFFSDLSLLAFSFASSCRFSSASACLAFACFAIHNLIELLPLLLLLLLLLLLWCSLCFSPRNFLALALAHTRKWTCTRTPHSPTRTNAVV